MKLLRAALSIVLSLSLIVLSPGLEACRLFAQTVARTGLAPVVPTALPGQIPGSTDMSAPSPALDSGLDFGANPALNPALTSAPEAPAALAPAALAHTPAAALQPVSAAVQTPAGAAHAVAAPAIEDGRAPSRANHAIADAPARAEQEHEGGSMAAVDSLRQAPKEQLAPMTARMMDGGGVASAVHGLVEGDAAAPAAPSQLQPSGVRGVAEAPAAGVKSPEAAKPAATKRSWFSPGLAITLGGSAVIGVALTTGLLGTGLPAFFLAGVALFAVVEVASLFGSKKAPAAAKKESAPAKAEAPAPATPDQNLASFRQDIARRTEAAPGTRPAGQPRIVIAAAKRLPYTPYSLDAQESAKSMGARVVKAAIEAAGLAVSEVEALAASGTRVKIFFGSVDTSKNPNVAREVAVEVGLPSVPGTGICKNCGTSLETAALGMSELIARSADLVIVGGAEAMSQFPQWTNDPVLRKLAMTLKMGPSVVAKLPAWQKPIGYGNLAWTWVKFKWRLFNLKLRYAIAEGLSIAGVSMIETAEALAGLFGITRDQMDWFSFRSQEKAARAAKNGDFAAEMVPYTPKGGKGPVETDMGIRFKNSRAGLRKLKGVLGTTITPAQASQMTDGASAMVMTTEEKARELGLVPLAYLEASNEVGVDQNLMGLGPAYSIPQAIKEAGISLKDVGIIHINEAFAPQILAVLQLLGIEARDPRVNPQGGAIARGHPLAATGSGLGATTIHAQRRHDHRYGVCSACIGGGEGASLVFYKEPHLVSRSFRESLQKRLEARGVSAAVRQRVDEEINGLPTVVRLGKDGLEGYPSVWRFLDEVNRLADEGSAESYSAVAEAMLYGQAMSLVRSRLSPGAVAFLEEAIRKDHPEFVAAFEREFGEKTFNGETAVARWLALESYKRTSLTTLVELAPLPESLNRLFSELGGVLGGNVIQGLDFATLQELATFLGEKAGASAHVHSLKEVASFGAGLDQVVAKAKADIALFGQTKSVFKNFKFTVDSDGVATVAISHEPVNSLNQETVQELEQLIGVLGSDSRVKSIVFTGDGDKFIVGADINLLSSVKSAAEATALAEGLQKVLYKLESLNKPVVMALNGQTLGGGLELAMSGHERIASGLAELGQPEVQLGLNPGAGGTQRLPRLVGLTKALEMMTKGEAIDAYTAKQYRLVDRVVAPADLLAEARKRAKELAAMSDQEKEDYFRTHRTSKRRVRMNPIERVGVYFGKGPVLGLGLGVAAPFFLGAWWTFLTGAAFGFGIGSFIASKFTRNKWALRGAGALGAVGLGSLATVLLPGWAVVTASAVFGLALGLYFLPGNGWLIKRQAASLTPEPLKFILPVVNSIIDATLAGVKKGPRVGSAIEARIFGKLAMGMARLFTATFIQPSRIKSAAEPLPVKRIAVIGAGGVMGSGISQFSLHKGISVTVNEFNPTFVQKALARIRGLWDSMLKKDKMEAWEVDQKMDLALGESELEKVVDSDPAIIIEAIPEVEAMKVGLFEKLGRIIKAKGKKTILASNTSALSITKLANASGQRSRFIGLHYFNPVDQMRLVEVILPDIDDTWTDAEKAEFEQTKATALAYLKKLGKTPVVAHDRPGFVVNRTLGDYIGEANRLVLEGATIAQIDKVMKKLGSPMGPLELTDHISLPLGVEVGTYLASKLPYLGKLPGLMPRLAAWGYSGKQWGKNEGFYTYKEEKDKKTGEPKRKLDAPNYGVVETAVALEHALRGVDAEAEALAQALTDKDDAAIAAAGRAFQEALDDRLIYLEAALPSYGVVKTLRSNLNVSRRVFSHAGLNLAQSLRDHARLLLDQVRDAQGFLRARADALNSVAEERAAMAKALDRKDAAAVAAGVAKVRERVRALQGMLGDDPRLAEVLGKLENPETAFKGEGNVFAQLEAVLVPLWKGLAEPGSEPAVAGFNALRQFFIAHRRTGITDQEIDQEIEERLMFVMVNEAARILGEKVVESPVDVDVAMLTGTGIGLTLGGLLRYADKKGVAYIVKKLEQYSKAGGGEVFKPAQYLLDLAKQGKGFYGDDQSKPARRGGLGALAKKLFAWAPALGAVVGAVLGGAMGGSGKTGLEREAASMMKTSAKKPEAFIPDFYRGSLDLEYLGKLDTKLDAAHQARVDAIKELIRIGLRTKGQSGPAESAALAALDRPTPAMTALLAELELDPASIREAIVDPHQIDSENDVPAAVLQRMNDMGLFRLKKPKEYGGLGLHQKEYGQVLRAMGGGISGSLGGLVSAYNTIGTAPLMMFGTPEQKEKYLRMRKPVSFGLTEPLAGTDLNKLGTTATLSADGKTWKLSGEKIFITGIMDAGVVYLVSGHTVVNGLDLGPSVFIADLPFEINESWEAKKAKLVELAGKGMRITPFTRDGFELMMIRGTDQGFIQMKDFEVPAENVLGPVGKGKIVPLLSLNAGRAGFGPYVSEAANWIAAQALEWAADRKMFDMYSPKEGEPGIQGFMEYPVTKLGRMQIKTAAMEDVSDLVSAMIDEAGDKLGVAALSAAIKTRITDQSWEISQDALELGGGHALIKGAPNGMELAFRDSWIAKIVEGVNAAMAQFVHLIGGGAVAKEMATIGGIVRFLKNQVRNRARPWRYVHLLGASLLALAGLTVAAVTMPWPAVLGPVVAFTLLELSALGVARAWKRGARRDGGLSWRAASWIQSRAARFAFRFGMTAQRLGQAAFGRRQNTLIRAYNVLMDIFVLAAVEKRLAEDRAALSPEKIQAREAAIKILKASIDANMKYISPKGHPIENLESAVGKAYVEAELARRDRRDNVVDAHMRFLHDFAEAFQRRIASESGTTN